MGHLLDKVIFLSQAKTFNPYFREELDKRHRVVVQFIVNYWRNVTYTCTILPLYLNEKFVRVNLAEENTDPVDMREVKNQILMTVTIRIKHGDRPTFGGYGEERVNLWKGFEQSKKMIHLGIDINNLRVGTPVTVPCDCTVYHTFRDRSESNGWGGRIIFRMREEYKGAAYLLYGHLDHNLPEIGREFRKGEVVGRIGSSEENGNWFIHIHVQLLTEKMISMYSNLDLIDGYLLDSDSFTMNEVSVDPTDLVMS
jgi:hypothetical protein